jgi:hypothetical protein
MYWENKVSMIEPSPDVMEEYNWIGDMRSFSSSGSSDDDSISNNGSKADE